jgi:hypothetical protein
VRVTPSTGIAVRMMRLITLAASRSGCADLISAAIPAADARLRAALITLTIVGVIIGRQLLDVAELHDVDPERIAALLRPSLRALTDTEH